jgi:succinate dehydrogenase hydrophobic anchor subunit
MKPNRFPIPFLILAILALLAALWAGLMRLGWQLPALTPSLALAHGPLMISGFLGILIPLERAVAMQKKWMYIPPLLAGLGWLANLLMPSPPLGPILLTLASFGGVAILIEMTRHETALHTITMLLGMSAWFVGNLLWLFGWQIFQVVFFWQAFLVLTIAGERLELSRVLRPSRQSQLLFGSIVAVYLAGILIATFNLQLGTRLNGAALLFLALWSVRNDLAWRNLKHKLPLTRYIAWCLALGLTWLGVGGGLSLMFGAQVAGPRHDAVLHVVFVGFVISMIFGHAPIIFPAIVGVPINFQPAFYIHLILLHASLALRVVADYANLHPLRMWGGLLNEVAILVFIGMTVYSIRKSLIAKA